MSLWISAVGVAVALLAVGVAIRANRHSDRSATASESSAAAAQASADQAARANEIATEANERADRADRRATARNDVVWRAELDDDYRLVVVNRGADSAHDVEFVLYVNDTRIRELQGPAFDIVPAGDTVTVHPLGELHNEARAEAQRRSNEVFRAQTRFHVECRVAWQDAAGGPHADQVEPRRRRR